MSRPKKKTVKDRTIAIMRQLDLVKYDATAQEFANIHEAQARLANGVGLRQKNKRRKSLDEQIRMAEERKEKKAEREAKRAAVRSQNNATAAARRKKAKKEEAAAAKKKAAEKAKRKAEADD